MTEDTLMIWASFIAGYVFCGGLIALFHFLGFFDGLLTHPVEKVAPISLKVNTGDMDLSIIVFDDTVAVWYIGDPLYRTLTFDRPLDLYVDGAWQIDTLSILIFDCLAKLDGTEEEFRSLPQ